MTNKEVIEIVSGILYPLILKQFNTSRQSKEYTFKIEDESSASELNLIFSPYVAGCFNIILRKKTIQYEELTTFENTFKLLSDCTPFYIKTEFDVQFKLINAINENNLLDLFKESLTQLQEIAIEET